MRTFLPRRGFTIVELMVGTTVSSMVLIGVAAVVIAINGAYQSHMTTKQASENGRLALTYVERTLRMAGYGLTPEQAFDFDALNLPDATKDNYSETLTNWGAYTTDDLAFRYRDPYYLRRGSLADLTGPTYVFELDLSIPPPPAAPPPTNLGRTFNVGELVQVACVGSQGTWLGRVEITAAKTVTSVTLRPHDGSTVPPTCTLEEGSFLMRIHEKRLRIITIGDTPQTQRPFLVVYHDWRTPLATNTNFDPIAVDVESFQVSYHMNRPQGSSTVVPVPDAVDNHTNSNWVLGDVGNSDDLLPSLDASVAPPPSYDTPYDHALRYNAHPANIRAVQIGIAARAPRPNSQRSQPTPIRLANHQFVLTSDNYARMVVETVVRVPNMTSRAFFTPTHRNESDLYDRRNVWGG